MDVGGWVSRPMLVVLADRPIVRSSDWDRDFYRLSPFPQTNDYHALYQHTQRGGLRELESPSG